MVKPTYYLIKVKEIKDNVYILENGSLRAVLVVPGVNIELMNEEDQNMLLSQFKSLLDGLDFPLQIFVYSRYENLDNYLKLIQARYEEETNPLIKFQIDEYIKFLEDYLENHKVMRKMFFVIVPYDTATSEIPLPIAQKVPQAESYQEMLFQLETRVDYVTQILSNMGLMPIRLNNLELLELLFECYNPTLRYGQIPKQIIEKLTEFLG
jgi:type IV secretory pathway VirB4 component